MRSVTAGCLSVLACFFSSVAKADTDCGANTWLPTWATSPDEACAVWANSEHTWGALANGQTLEEGCRTSTFAQRDCALTCCAFKMPLTAHTVGVLCAALALVS